MVGKFLMVGVLTYGLASCVAPIEEGSDPDVQALVFEEDDENTPPERKFLKEEDFIDGGPKQNRDPIAETKLKNLNFLGADPLVQEVVLKPEEQPDRLDPEEKDFLY